MLTTASSALFVVVTVAAVMVGLGVIGPRGLSDSERSAAAERSELRGLLDRVAVASLQIAPRLANGQELTASESTDLGRAIARVHGCLQEMTEHANAYARSDVVDDLIYPIEAALSTGSLEQVPWQTLRQIANDLLEETDALARDARFDSTDQIVAARRSATDLFLLSADHLTTRPADPSLYAATVRDYNTSLVSITSLVSTQAEPATHREASDTGAEEPHETGAEETHTHDADSSVGETFAPRPLDSAEPPTLRSLADVGATLIAIDEILTRHQDATASSRKTNLTVLLAVGAIVLGVVVVWMRRRDRERSRADREELHHRATVDELTGLLNRTQVSSVINQVALTSRHGAGLLYFDLDGFKLVNDSFGHHVGDVLLAEVADRVRQLLREDDRAIRLGGDEFLVVLCNIRGPHELKSVGERLVEAISRPCIIEGSAVAVGASVGTVFYHGPVEDDAALVRTADAALYVAKRSGRGRVVIAGPDPDLEFTRI